MSVYLLVRDSAGWSRREYPAREGMAAQTAFSLEAYQIDPDGLMIIGPVPVSVYREPGSTPPAVPPPGVYFIPGVLLKFARGGFRVEWDRWLEGVVSGVFRSDSMEWVESDKASGIGGHLRPIGGRDRPGAPAPGSKASKGG